MLIKSLVLTLSSVLINTCYGEAEMIKMYRESVSEVKLGNFGGVIQHNKPLIPTQPSNNGFYLFSEIGSGVKPLILVGTIEEIILFFRNNEKVGIENRIKELPYIYMGVAPYVPGEEFYGLFPFNDFIELLVKQVTGIAADPMITNPSTQTIISLSDLSKKVNLLFIFNKLKSEHPEYKSKSFLKKAIGRDRLLKNKKIDKLYVKFSYLDDGFGWKSSKGKLFMIGDKKITFKEIYDKNFKDIKIK